MSAFEALILGIIQGLTEFLPVSSSGHLELGAYFLGVKSNSNLLFAIIVHGATALSTVVVFRKTILELIIGLLQFRWNGETQYAAKILVSMIPLGIVGVFFEKEVASLFAGNILLVAGMLSITGLLLLLTNYAKKQTGEITFTKSIIIGIAQSIAILPGISRSGATISTALLTGVEKSKAAKFSFLMVLPPILGATFLMILDYMDSTVQVESFGFTPLFVGFVAAFVSGLLACTWMIKLVKNGKLIYFAIYCFILSAIVLIATLF